MAHVYDSEGFQLVVRGARPRQAARPSPDEYSGPPCKDLVAAILHTKNGLESSFTCQVVRLLKDIPCEAIVCYGIGRFGMCRIARQQLALLLHIATATGPRGESVAVYDPVLSSPEKEALEQLGCTNIHHNELCRRQARVCTLFYMPHCGRAMYDNLLWANWSPRQLARVALIGNSFQSYVERVPTQELREEAPFINSLLPYCKEHPLPPYLEPTVFNDLSLHTFPHDLLLAAPADMWASLPPPPTPSSDPEIIS